MGLDGRTYHSAFEAQVSNIYMADSLAGKITVIKQQQHIHLFSGDVKLCEYWPDFTIRDANGEVYWAEAKGHETTDWLIKLNLWRAGGPGRLDVWRGDWRRPRLVERIIPANPGLHIRHDQVWGKL